MKEPYLKKIQRGIIDLQTLLIRINPLLVFLLVSLLFVFFRYDSLIGWKAYGFPFKQDAADYYSYLTSTFIHHDSYFHYIPEDEVYLIRLSNGSLVPRYTMGVSVMESPFFFIGHFIAGRFNYPVTGYSGPYIWSIYFGTIAYVLAGVCLMYRMLSAYFNKWLSALTAFSLFFCTNLLYYSVSFGQMAHSYAFFMLCLFLYSLFRFYREHKLLQLYLCAFSAGMLVLIRPSDGIVLLIPLLLGVHSRQEFKTWWSFLGSIKMAVAGAALFFIGIVSLQLIYWKLHTGHFLVNGYGDERFFFNDPQVTNFLFSFRKGLIPYTPIMLLLFPGYLILYRNYRELFWPLIAFQALNIYLLSCWWDWGYGGSFGNRALVDSFPVFAIPIAALFDFIYKRFVQPKGKIIVTGLICLCVYSCFNFNIYLIKKYNSSQIHWSDMTAEAYWFVVLNTNFQGSDFKKLNELLKPVNAAAHKKGKDRDH